jgi:hypothetical protein
VKSASAYRVLAVSDRAVHAYLLPLHDMEAARDVLLGVLARGGAAAALVPGLVKDSLQASPNVVTDDAATIQRVSA